MPPEINTIHASNDTMPAGPQCDPSLHHPSMDMNRCIYKAYPHCTCKVVKGHLEVLICKVTAEHVIIASPACKGQKPSGTHRDTCVSEQYVFTLTMLYHLLSMLDAVCSASFAGKIFPVTDLHSSKF